MDVRRYASAPDLLAVAGAALNAEEARNSLLLGFAGSNRPWGGCELGLAALSGGRVAGALVQTSINEAVLSVCSALAARALGRALAEARTGSYGIVGPTPEVDAAAAAFAQRAGVSIRPQRRLLLHRIDREPDARGGAAVLRAATEDDVPLLTRWAAGFDRDTRSPRRSEDSGDRVRQAIGAERLFVLTVRGAPVAAASWSRPTAHTRTINCVYTPPEERGKGRGRTVTAMLVRRLLSEGAGAVLIFTDADDPVPNRVYARVGFQPLAPFAHWEFVRPGA